MWISHLSSHEPQELDTKIIPYLHMRKQNMDKFSNFFKVLWQGDVSVGI